MTAAAPAVGAGGLRRIGHIDELFRHLKEIEGSYSVFAFAPDNQDKLDIRDVYAKNKDKVKDVLYKIEAAGVPCCFFGHSSEAILHSKKIGLITEKDVIAQTELVTD